MRRYFIIITMLCFKSISYSQEKIDTVSVYYQALKCYVAHIDEFNKDSLMQKELYFEYIRGITYKLPTKILGYKITFLNSAQVESILHKQKGISLYLFFPIEEKDDKFIISIQDAGVNKRGRNIMYSVGSGCLFVYSYDCFQRKLILEEILNTGP